METVDFSLDAVYGVLSESRRRYVLYYFLENDQANIDGLALQIAAWEQDVSIDSVREEQTQQITTSLVHSHLPKLADHNLVDYDGRTGDVIVGDHFDRIRPTITQARAAEEDVEVTGSSIESVLYSDPLTRSSGTNQ